jgi:putative membrane protein
MAIAIFHIIPIFISSVGWYVMMPGRQAPALGLVVYFMWIRAAVNNLMPVARVGGEFAAVRLMKAHGISTSYAIAANVVELTVSVLALFSFVVIGVILFALRIENAGATGQMAWGLVCALPVLAAFVAVQRIGIFGLLSRLFHAMFHDKWTALAGNAARLDRIVMAFYRHRGRLAACGVLQFVAWALGAVDIWLALQFLGHPLPPSEALMIEALIQGSVSAAFAVPGALGVQEAGFIFFGGMLGLPHEIAAALAVIRRCRDLLCYAPGLIVWQTHEGKRLLRS